VRCVDAKTKIITTIAGTGMPGFSGDGGPAIQAQLNRPHSIALDSLGNVFIADIGNHRIRRVDHATGKIETFAGNGKQQLPTRGHVVSDAAPMLGPRALFYTKNTIWLALREGHSIWQIDIPTRIIQLVAGTGEKGYRDGLPLETHFDGPKGIAVDSQARVYVVDTENQVIRLIDTKRNVTTTFAGNNKRGFSGDRGSATEAAMDRPHGICISQKGDVYIGDTNNHRVRVVECISAKK